MPDADVVPFQTTGHVASGVGRGAEFLGLEWVRSELRRTLSLVPFPGTLNLRVPPEVRDALFTRRESFLRIADPAAPTCPGYLQRVILRANGGACSSAYLILPELTMYKDVLEVIAAENLRQRLRLKDGDLVEVEEFLAY
jgi:riboflavin kinase